MVMMATDRRRVLGGVGAVEAAGASVDFSLPMEKLASGEGKAQLLGKHTWRYGFGAAKLPL